MRLLIAAALLATAPALIHSAGAQTPVRSLPPDSYRFLPASEIDREISKPEAGRVYGAWVINDHENYYQEFVKRLDHGNGVELHPHWVDQITIISGEGVLTFGGTVTGGTIAASGELRGGTQVGATTQKLAPGDFVLIPAGLAHKFDAAPGKTLTYVVAKARS